MKALPVINLKDTKYEGIFGRGCDGICCQNGRPGVNAEEIATIEAGLQKFLPHLLPNARRLIEEQGFTSQRRRHQGLMLRVIDGWCVFFNQGCVLHKVGAEEGDKFRYKPQQCALFPLAQDEHDRWYVRQHGYKNEQWDLFCLAPDATRVAASVSLDEEVKLALQLSQTGKVDLPTEIKDLVSQQS